MSFTCPWDGKGTATVSILCSVSVQTMFIVIDCFLFIVELYSQRFKITTQDLLNNVLNIL